MWHEEEVLNTIKNDIDFLKCITLWLTLLKKIVKAGIELFPLYRETTTNVMDFIVHSPLSCNSCVETVSRMQT